MFHVESVTSSSSSGMSFLSGNVEVISKGSITDDIDVVPNPSIFNLDEISIYKEIKLHCQGCTTYIVKNNNLQQ